MDTIKISGETRENFGKSANKHLRKSGKIPAVLYGGDKVEHFCTTHNEVKKLIYTPDFKLAEISTGSATHKAIIKEIQFHPVTDQISHIDFLKLQDGVKIKLEVPVKCVGVSPGILAGGALIQSLRKIKINTTPEHIIDELTVDISGVELGGAIRVKDIEVGDNIEIMNNPSVPIATVSVPRALKSEQDGAEDEGAAEGAEGEGEAPAAE